MNMRSHLCALLPLCVACGSQTESRFVATQAGGDGAGGTIIVGTGSAGGAAGTDIVTMGPTDSGTADGPVIITMLPPGFTQTEVGGYLLGGALAGRTDAGSAADAGSGTTNCGNVLLGVVRDFKGRSQPGGHPDFEGPLYGNDVTTGLVATNIDVDQKPLYASQCEEGHASPAPTCPFGPETTTKPNFDEWYRYTVGVNLPFLLNLWFAPQGAGLFRFESHFFFPVDDVGFGNSGTADDGKQHNFSFTTELHTRFAYNGGETFQFDGDDDVWVFINGKLAVDVGGLHPRESRSVALDASAAALGIQRGETYSLDLFHAERHTPQSNFRIDTNLAFVNCGILPGDIVR
jgi:fibro-slime domain-containing protein